MIGKSGTRLAFIRVFRRVKVIVHHLFGDFAIRLQQGIANVVTCCEFLSTASLSVMIFLLIRTKE
jgi:hypothetical protein